LESDNDNTIMTRS